MSGWRLEIRPAVRDWLRQIRKEDRQLAWNIAQAIQMVLDAGPGLGRPLVDSLKGREARRIGLKEMRAEGTLRIAFVFHGGTVLVLLAHGDKRDISSTRFYRELIAGAVAEYEAWLDENEEGDHDDQA